MYEIRDIDLAKVPVVLVKSLEQVHPKILQELKEGVTCIHERDLGLALWIVRNLKGSGSYPSRMTTEDWTQNEAREHLEHQS